MIIKFLENYAKFHLEYQTIFNFHIYYLQDY